MAVFYNNMHLRRIFSRGNKILVGPNIGGTNERASTSSTWGGPNMGGCRKISIVMEIWENPLINQEMIVKATG